MKKNSAKFLLSLNRPFLKRPVMLSEDRDEHTSNSRVTFFALGRFAVAFFFRFVAQAGCKENQFYSLPFGQAEASIY